MSSEPKRDAENGAVRAPVSISLVPKRRFKAAPPPAEEETPPPEEAARPYHRQKLKRTGRVVLRWPSKATQFGHVPPAPLTVRSYAP